MRHCNCAENVQRACVSRVPPPRPEALEPAADAGRHPEGGRPGPRAPARRGCAVNLGFCTRPYSLRIDCQGERVCGQGRQPKGSHGCLFGAQLLKRTGHISGGSPSKQVRQVMRPAQLSSSQVFEKSSEQVRAQSPGQAGMRSQVFGKSGCAGALRGVLFRRERGRARRGVHARGGDALVPRAGAAAGRARLWARRGCLGRRLRARRDARCAPPGTHPLCSGTCDRGPGWWPLPLLRRPPPAVLQHACVRALPRLAC